MGHIASKRFQLKNGIEIVIRSAQVSDANQLYNQAFFNSEFVVPNYDELDLSVEQQQDWVRFRMDHPNHIIIVACIGENILGWVTFENSHFSQREHHGYLGITVKEEWRSLGVGRILLQSLLSWGVQHPKLEMMFLTVLETNHKAISLYKDLGFRKYGVFPSYTRVRGRLVNDLIMCKFLK